MFSHSLVFRYLPKTNVIAGSDQTYVKAMFNDIRLKAHLNLRSTLILISHDTPRVKLRRDPRCILSLQEASGYGKSFGPTLLMSLSVMLRRKPHKVLTWFLTGTDIVKQEKRNPLYHRFFAPLELPLVIRSQSKFSFAKPC